FDVLGAVDGVLGVLGVCVSTGVEVVDQRAGALVAALAAAVEDAGHGGQAGIADGLHRGHKVVGGPGAGLLVEILQGGGRRRQRRRAPGAGVLPGADGPAGGGGLLDVPSAVPVHLPAGGADADRPAAGGGLPAPHGGAGGGPGGVGGAG